MHESGSAIYRLDGMTGTQSGNPPWTYTSASGNNLSTPVVHTDGTIFTVDGASVVGINPTTLPAAHSQHHKVPRLCDLRSRRCN
jgi:hypothetical protein